MPPPPSVPPARVRANDWRSLRPPPANAFVPTLPVTIVVPYYEAPEALALTLAALERQTYPRSLFEVIVVDDGSKVRPEVPVPSPLEIRVLRQEDRGFGLARARNRGARAARHPVLVFLDCDMLPEAGWLAAHARWHHAACDLLTLGLRAHVEVDGIHAAAILDHQGGLDSLFRGRSVDHPEWIELYLARTSDLTALADDPFRVVTGGNLGISRWFFEQVGGFDESFDRWGMEDTELGYRAYTLGGPLVPVREAFCWHQGAGAKPSPAERESLALQRAKVSHLIAHPDFRAERPGRGFTVPSFVVTVDPLDRTPEVILATVEEVLAGTVHDLVVWVGRAPGARTDDWLGYSLDPDPRVFAGPPDGAPGRFPGSPFHIRVPAGIACDPGMVDRMRDALGASAAAVGWLPDRSRVSIVRAWALHRARRTGQRIEDLGRVTPLATSDLQSGGPSRRPRVRARRAAPTSKALRALRSLCRVRTPRQAWTVLRWIASAVRARSVAALRRRRRGGRGDAAERAGEPAHYPLGLEIAVSGSGASRVFAASSRVHHPTGEGYLDVIVADTTEEAPSAGSGAGLPLVTLADAPPRLAVPAFDPEQVNPAGWAREGRRRAGALGPARILPSGVRVQTVVSGDDPRGAARLHHVEDIAAFHPDPIHRAATLATLAAAGTVVHLTDADTELEARLGHDLYTAMRDDRIPAADARLREMLSIRMRRASLRRHSLRARARQVAEAASLPNHVGIPTVSVVLPTKRPALLGRSLETVAAQTYPRLELVLALHGDGFPAGIDTSAVPFPVEVLRAPSGWLFGAVLNEAVAAAGGTLLAKMDDDDHYGRDHIWDLVLAREFSRAELVAKGAEFVHLVEPDRTIHRYAGRGETYPELVTIAGGALLISAHDLMEVGGWRRVPAAVDQRLVTDLTRLGGPGLPDPRPRIRAGTPRERPHVGLSRLLLPRPGRGSPSGPRPGVRRSRAGNRTPRWIGALLDGVDCE